MRFFKNGCGKPGIGVCFYNNGNEKKSLYIVGRGVLTPYFMKIPLYCLPSLFSNFVHLLPLSPTPSPTVLSVVLFLWLTGWSYYIWCAILLNVIMDLHMLSLGTLHQKDLDMCFMLQGIKFTELWLIMWFFTSTLNWLSPTHSALRDQ